MFGKLSVHALFTKHIDHIVRSTYPLIMNSRLFFTVVLGIVMMFGITGKKISRFKRNYEDKFNVLLNIYKMQILKKSDIFKKHRDRILLLKYAPQSSLNVLNIDSNESRKAKRKRIEEKFNPIENVSNVTLVPDNNTNKNISGPTTHIYDLLKDAFYNNVMFMNDPDKEFKTEELVSSTSNIDSPVNLGVEGFVLFDTPINNKRKATKENKAAEIIKNVLTNELGEKYSDVEVITDLKF